MIKNIVFDNGGVIVKYSAKTYLNYFKFKKTKKQELDKLFTSSKWVEFAKGEITSEQFKEYALNTCTKYKEDVLKVLDKENLKFLLPIYDKTINFIKELKQKGYNVYLLSDINEDTIYYMNKAVDNFESLFDGLVYSCRVGMVKKDGEVFNYLLNTFNLKAEETLFLDDIRTNLERAKEKGIKTYRFLNPSKDIKIIKNKYITEEVLDVFDINKKHIGVKTRSFCHSDNPGVYHKAVWIWVKNSKNQILVQKRSKLKKKSPLKWDMPIAGHVDAGETPLSTCVRETKEEIGIKTKSKDFKLLKEFVNQKGWEHVSVYLLQCDIDTTKVNLQPEEVEEVKWLNYEEFVKLLYSQDFCNHDMSYRDWVSEVLKS